MLNTANLKFKRHSYLKVLSKYTTQNTIHNLQILTTLSSSWQFTTCPTIGLGERGSPSYSSAADNRPVRRCERRGRGCQGSVVGPTVFSSCSWVRSTKTPSARSGRTPSQMAPCRCSILQSLVDAPSGSILPPPLPHDRIRWICLLHGPKDQLYVLWHDSLREYRRLFALL